MTLNYPQKPNGMYVISRNDMDNIARMLLKEYAPLVLVHPQPVRIATIAEEGLYLTLQYQNIDPSILGLTVFGDSKLPCYDDLYRPIVKEFAEGTVLVNALLSTAASAYRRRYTVAHETSHWILHRSYHSATNQQYQFRTDEYPYIACREDTIETNNRSVADGDTEEWQADSLAAAILMPYDIFAPFAYRSIRNNTGSTHLSAARKDAYHDVLSELSEAFAVSKKAAEIRLRHIELIKA